MSKRVKIVLFIILLAAFILLGNKYGFDLNDTRSLEVSLNGEKFMVEVADTAAEQTQGLSVKDGLGVNEGMLFVFGKPGTRGFWMKDMRFPIDIIWIDGDKVVDVSPNVSPDSYPQVFTSPFPADKVLEINAGLSQKFGIKEGSPFSLK